MQKLYAARGASLCRLPRSRPFVSLLALFLTLFFAGNVFAQTVATDKADYAPGEFVIVTGSGWQPGETVQLVFTETPLMHPPDILYAVAANDGTIYNADYQISDHDLGQFFTLVATGLTSGLTAQTTFTDGPASDGDGTMTVSPVYRCTGGNGLSYTFAFNGGSGNAYGAGSAVTLRVPWSITTSNVATNTPTNILAGSMTPITVSPVSGGSLITIPFQTSGNGPTFNIVVSGTGVNMPNNAAYDIQVQTRSGAAGTLKDIDAFPIIATGNGPLGSNGYITGSKLGCESVNSAQFELFGHTGNVVRWEKRNLTNLVGLVWGPWQTINNTSTSLNANASLVNGTIQVRAITTGATCGAPINGTPEYASDTATIAQSSLPAIVATDVTSFGNFSPYFGQDQVGPPPVDGNVDVWSVTSSVVKYYIGGVGGTEISYPHVFAPGSTTVTVSATNACGSTTATFNVIVGIPPQITCPANIIQDNDPGVCKAVVNYTLTYDGGSATATPAAGHYIGNPQPTISYSLDNSTFLPGTGSGLEYPKGTTTVYLKAENGGGTATCSFTITVEDKEAPVLVNPLVGCNSLDIPNVDECLATAAAWDATQLISSVKGLYKDNCDNDLTVTYEGSQPGVANTNCSWSFTYSFKIADDDGNNTTCTVTRSGADKTAPDITTDASAGDAECEGTDANANSGYMAWLANNGGAVASDLCSNVTWSNNASTQSWSGACIQTITVTFTATDECNNSSTTTAVFTIHDTTPPDITTDAANDEAECEGTDANANSGYLAWLANNAGAVASDLCGNNVIWTNNAATQSWSGSCTQTITVTFTATDDCNNSSTTTAVFTIHDYTAPDITTDAAAGSAECEGTDANANSGYLAWLANNGGAVASDLCGNNVTWTNNAATQSWSGSCTQTITVTFTATDDCNNSSSTTAVFTIHDTTPPDITTDAANDNAECEGGDPNANSGYIAWLSNNGGAAASDLCGNNVTWSNNSASQSWSGTCTQTITITFTATDDCGNASTTTATFTINDTQKPVFGTITDITGIATDPGTCNATVNVPTPTATDQCAGTVSVTGERDDLAALDAPYPFGTTTITWTADDGCGNTETATQLVKVEFITPTITVTFDPASQQYSDHATITATIVPPKCGDSEICGDVTFKIGNTEVGTATIVIDGDMATATWTGCIPVGPGIYNVSTVFAGCGDFAAASGTASTDIEVTPEDADGEYIGLTFAQTSCATCDKATVTLSATIWDLQSTGEENDADGCGGDIRNALVRFIAVPTGNGTNYTSPWLPVGLIDPNDPLRGTATINGVDLLEGNYTIFVEIGGYYQAVSEIMSSLNISRPSQTDFITGGGYVIPTNSNGLYATNYEGSKTNFGFNIKYNKSGKKLQGNFNLIFRRKEGGEVKTYQIKGTALGTLTVSPDETQATFSGKGNLSEIIDGVAYGIQGGATLIVDVTDNGEPGTGKDPVDMIAVSLLSKDGGLLYSTNWVGTRSEQMLLDGGNIQVNGSRVVSYAAKKNILTASADQLEVKVSNNPSTGASSFKLQLLSNDHSTPINLTVRDINGRSVEARSGLQQGTNVEIGRSFTSGMYLLEVVQGNQRKMVKLLKQ